MPLKTITDFLKLESTSGILLGLVALGGLILMNSPFRHFYLNLASRTEFIISDIFMSIFFLLVGLEIKRELITGELNTFKKVLLPGVAAFFGMACPALIYMAFNYNHLRTFRGWAIPTATDIAFTLTVLSLLKTRIPMSLKIFLMALAIFDDLGAIIIIAVFYAKNLHFLCLLTGSGIFGILLLMNYFNIKRIGAYLLVGTLLWVCVLKSGVHPTVAGVLVALTIPVNMISSIEKRFHYWVAYFVLPLFAFINMQIPFEKLSFHTLHTPVALGIILGLSVGKFLGIFSAVFIMVKSGFARLPTGCNWKMMVGASFLCGIGFTMSLFIGDLAFRGNTLELVRMGVLTGSVLSGVVGYLILRTK